MKRLTPKQQHFIQHYTDERSDTFGNAARSYIKAGYKDSSNARINASRLLTVPQVRQELERIQDTKRRKAAFNLHWLDERLKDLARRCKEAKDRSNEAAALRLIGQRLAAYTDKHGIEDTRIPEMSDKERAEMQEIAHELARRKLQFRKYE